jgi:hypothetical protein
MKSIPIPSSGGSYTRGKNGKLVQTQKPTLPALKKPKDQGIAETTAPDTASSKET